MPYKTKTVKMTRPKTFIGFAKIGRKTASHFLFTRSELDAARRRWEKRQLKRRLKRNAKRRK